MFNYYDHCNQYSQCPACGAAVEHAEAGNVPGWRRCTACSWEGDCAAALSAEGRRILKAHRLAQSQADAEATARRRRDEAIADARRRCQPIGLSRGRQHVRASVDGEGFIVLEGDHLPVQENAIIASLPAAWIAAAQEVRTALV